MSRTEQTTPRYDAIATALEEQDAVAYIHIGDDHDSMLRYLTRFDGPDREYAFVYTGDEATLCAPALFEEQAQREFPGNAVTANDGGDRPSAAARAATVIDAPPSMARVLVPASIPHHVYQELESIGYEVVTTSTLEASRTRKTSVEIEWLRQTETAAQAAMRRAEAVLADATPANEKLLWEDDPLTTERLRRVINAALAMWGATDAGNTVVGAGPSCSDLHYNGDDIIRPTETVLIDLGPRGPNGYFGDMTRTFVPGTVRKWERKAYETIATALDAGLDRLDDAPGIPANEVHATIVDIVEANGFSTGDVDVGLYHGTGHGVGAALHEPPFFSTDTHIEAGHVVTIEPGVYDPQRGGVRLEDLVLVTNDGIENLVEYPCQITPRSEETENHDKSVMD